MPNVSNASDEFRLYTLHSQKGGVGKTSLAIAIAALEGMLRGVRTVLIDMDITGTCLADALGVDPPAEQPRYVNDLLLASPDAFLDLTVHRRIGRSRKQPEAEYWRLYLHHWQAPRTDTTPFDYIASDPALDRVRQIVPSLAQEHNLHFYCERLRDAVVSLAAIGYRTVVVDLPPGLFGLSEAVFHLATDGWLEEAPRSKAPVRPRAIVVSTTDKMDYRAAFSTVWQLEVERHVLRPDVDPELVGRDADERDEQAGRRGNNPPIWQNLDWEVWFNKAKMQEPRGELDPAFALRDTFQDMARFLETAHRLPPPLPGYDARDTYGPALEHHRRVWEERSGVVLADTAGFSVERIAPAVDAMVARSREEGAPHPSRGSIEAWLFAVANALGLSWPVEGN